MKRSGVDTVVLAQAESEQRSGGNSAPPAEGGSALRTGTMASAEEARYSPDPLRKTDRYRLVTPYLSSSREL